MFTSMGSTEWLSISFRTGRSFLCSVVTSPSLNLEENLHIMIGEDSENFNQNLWPTLNRKRTNSTETDLPARPAICRACDVLIVSMCFSPFSLIFGLTRLLKIIRLILL